jgi:Lon protease-like protein
MVRRVMESGYARFGMCTHTYDGYAQVGVSAEIRRVEMLPDGRFLLETIGGRRFQVLERSVRNDYAVAKVEWLDDFPDGTPEEMACRPSTAIPLQGLQARVQAFALGVWRSFNDPTRERVLSMSGPIPADAINLVYWLVSFLPIDEDVKYQFLQFRSHFQRLHFLHGY